MAEQRPARKMSQERTHMRLFVGQVCAQRLRKAAQVGVQCLWTYCRNVPHRYIKPVDQDGDLIVLGFEPVDDRICQTFFPQSRKEAGGLAVVVEMQKLRVLVRRLGQALHVGCAFGIAQARLISDQIIDEAQHSVQLAPKHRVDAQKLAHQVMA